MEAPVHLFIKQSMCKHYVPGTESKMANMNEQTLSAFNLAVDTEGGYKTERHANNSQLNMCDDFEDGSQQVPF